MLPTQMDFAQGRKWRRRIFSCFRSYLETLKVKDVTLIFSHLYTSSLLINYNLPFLLAVLISEASDLMAHSHGDMVTQLEDGSLVCSDHYLSRCWKCCLDFDFLNEEQESGDDDDANEDDDDETDGSTENDIPEIAQSSSNRRCRTSPSSNNTPMLTFMSGYASLKFSSTNSSTSLRSSSINSSTSRNVHATPQSMPSAPDKITRFYPPSPNDTPQSLFGPGNSPSPLSSGPRFVRFSNPQELLIYTDGCCLNNGQPNPKAGCAFVFRPATSSYPGGEHFRLELQGPSGDEYTQTSNRAELRAVIAALKFRAWHGEGFSRLVIATDSDYIVSGITKWIHSWARNGWRTTQGAPVKNRDLWELLIKTVKDKSQSMYVGTNPLEVLFWLIPRKLNTVADQLAKEAAASKPDERTYTDILGVLI